MVDLQSGAYIAEIVMAVGGVCSGCYWFFPRFYRWAIRPQLVFEFFDSSSFPLKDKNIPYAMYFLSVKHKRILPFSPDYSSTTIKLILKSDVSSSDFEVNVTNFLTEIGCEHMKKVLTKQKNEHDFKEVEFNLEPYKKYRIIITGAAGRVGSLLLNNFSLEIEMEDNMDLLDYTKFPT